MIVYGIPNCDTVKKARTWLTANGFDYIFHDFKKQGISAEKLQEWCAVFGWETVLNKKGTTWKKLSAEQQIQVNNEDTAVAILLQNVSAIKRPVVEKEGKVLLIGFDETKYRQILK